MRRKDRRDAMATFRADYEDAPLTSGKPMAEPALDVAVQVVVEREALLPILASWAALVPQALDPNPLYQPDALLAALEAQGAGKLRCILVWERDPERSDQPARLNGLFPFRRERRWRGFPAATLRSLAHPLLRADGAQRTIAILLKTLAHAGIGIVEFGELPREGAFCSVLADALREHRSMPLVESAAAPAQGMQNVIIGMGALGELWVSMQPLLARHRGRAQARAASVMAVR
jgi:hypothetical protein